MMPFRKQPAINVTWPFVAGFNGRGAGWLDDVFIWMNFQKTVFFSRRVCKKTVRIDKFCDWNVSEIIQLLYPCGGIKQCKCIECILNWRDFPLVQCLGPNVL